MARLELVRFIDGKALDATWWGLGQMLPAIQHAGRMTRSKNIIKPPERDMEAQPLIRIM
jgi:hypothetical protein